MAGVDREKAAAERLGGDLIAEGIIAAVKEVGIEVPVVVRLEGTNAELGLKMPVHPKLSLQLEDRDGLRVCFLRFERVEVPLPLAGNVNIAYLLPRLPVPADNVTTFHSARGLFNVRTRLAEARMGSRALRLRFDLQVSPAAAAGGGPGIE